MIILKSNIEKLIEGSGLKKRYIAGKLNVGVHQLRNYETGKSLIPMDKAYILIDLLQCEISDLYERIDVE